MLKYRIDFETQKCSLKTQNGSKNNQISHFILFVALI